MRAIKEKIGYIFVPFLLVSSGFICIYTFLNWFLVIELRFFEPDQDLQEFWLPFALPWIPVLIFLRPRIHALRFKDDGRSRSVINFFATLAIAIPTSLAQGYLSDVTASHVTVHIPSKITSLAPSEYYTIDQYYVPKSIYFLDKFSEVTGGRHSRFNMYAHFVLPLCDSKSDTLDWRSNVWISVPYVLNTRVPSSNAEANDFFKGFMKNTLPHFKNRSLQNIPQFERLGNNAQYRFSKAALESALGSRLLTDPIILTERRTPYRTADSSDLMWIFLSFGIGALIWFGNIAFTGINKTELTQTIAGKRKFRALQPIIDYCVPRTGYFATPILLDLNILVFLLMVFSGIGVTSFRAEDLVNWGANYPPLVQQGEIWRLITSLFVHSSVFHLAFNLVALCVAGFILESNSSRRNTALVYFIGGIAGSLLGSIVHPNSVSCGASGAIFGMFGSVLSLVVRDVPSIKEARTYVLVVTGLFCGITLIFGAGDLTTNNAAHIGGLLSGFVAGLLFKPIEKSFTFSFGGRHLTGR